MKLTPLALALVTACALATPALAQTANPWNGNWTISFNSQRGADLEGSVVIKDDGGSWDIASRARGNACVGRPYPITVQSTSPEQLVFTVNREKTLAGCKDSTYTFKKVDDKTLQGELGDGRAASMVRK